MKEITVGSNEAGRRLDKVLGNVLNQASSGFIYKMLRKKNIKLNGQRAEGREILAPDDRIQIYLSEETFAKFHSDRAGRIMKGAGKPGQARSADPDGRRKSGSNSGGRMLKPEEILYRDEHIMLLNKPAGVLSQKAGAEEDSINEWMLRYLLEQGIVTSRQMETFAPSVCNRLDRNTSGILLAGISLTGSRELSRMLKERSLEKYYLALVLGEVKEAATVRAYLKKDETVNRVTVTEDPASGGTPIETCYRPLYCREGYTLLEVKLVTGKSHQIRAELSALGYPILGDARYGNQAANRRFRERFGVQNQCLHAWRVVFPRVDGAMEALSGREWKAPLPYALNRAIWELFGTDINRKRGL